jgi:hypothetical protein
MPVYEECYERPRAQLLGTMQTTTIERYDDLLQQIKSSRAIKKLAGDVMHRVLSISIMYIPNLQRIQELEEDSNNK